MCFGAASLRRFVCLFTYHVHLYIFLVVDYPQHTHVNSQHLADWPNTSLLDTTTHMQVPIPAINTNTRHLRAETATPSPLNPNISKPNPNSPLPHPFSAAPVLFSVRLRLKTQSRP